MKKNIAMVMGMLALTSYAGFSAAETRQNPGWALDRIDGTIDGQYQYHYTGANQVIYFLDTGLSLDSASVKAEFTDSNGNMRASNFYDFNYPNVPVGGSTGNSLYGNDCRNNNYRGHGTPAAIITAGKTYGVAEGAIVRMIKVGNNNKSCLIEESWVRDTLAYLAELDYSGNLKNIEPGNIIYINGAFDGFSSDPHSAVIRENIEIYAEILKSKGVNIILPTGNSGVDISNRVIFRSDATFVVGGTWPRRLNGDASPGGPLSQEAVGGGAFYQNIIGGGFDEVVYSSYTEFNKPSFSYGSSVDAYAPAFNVASIGKGGDKSTFTGTSYAGPIVAGIFAVACEVYPSACASPNSYQLIKDSFGLVGSVREENGKVLTHGGQGAVFLEQKL